MIGSANMPQRLRIYFVSDFNFFFFKITLLLHFLAKGDFGAPANSQVTQIDLSRLIRHLISLGAV